jgi:adenylylsulfate kinase
MSDEAHVTWHDHSVSRRDHEKLNGHQGCVLWFTGLSGCGKSTVANSVELLLHEQGFHTFLLDGDNIRHGLNATVAILKQDHDEAFADRFGLGFSSQDREENIRRIGEVAQLFCSGAIIVLTAFVSPYRRDRDAVRRRLEQAGNPGDFVEVFVDTPIEVCESRDPKGLYKKARAGEIRNFTGIDDPYEAPASPEITLAGGDETPDKLAQQVVDYLRSVGKLPPNPSSRS